MGEGLDHILFVYGTLRDMGVLSAVLGRPANRYNFSSAMVPGWRVVTYPGETYPALVRAPAGCARGLLIAGLDAADVGKLDAYEGTQYQRALLRVRCGGVALDAQAYIPVAKIPADAPEWSLDSWIANHRTRALADARALGGPEHGR